MIKKILLESENNLYLEGADTHIIYCKDYEPKMIVDMTINDYVLTKKGLSKVKKIKKMYGKVSMFDLSINTPEMSYYTNDILSHNTQYIRVLLKELSKVHKSILYAPPSLSASLTDPAMIEFISDWVLGEERDCILLIEDAEPLLEIRGGSDGRSIGISNLLNMTDGLLNDILGLTVIATFNTPLG